MEKNLHFRLSRAEKLQLRMHKSMCQACNLYEKQSIFMDKSIGKYDSPSIAEKDLKDLKSLIIERLEQ